MLAASPAPERRALAESPITEADIREAMARRFVPLQRHDTADRMRATRVTADFETGLTGGFTWSGPTGLDELLAARAGFIDERHELTDVLEVAPGPGGEVVVGTRVEFFPRRWTAPSPTSEELTGVVFHTRRLRRGPDGRWRAAAQLVDRFADLNDSAARRFGTPDEGLDR